MKKAERVNKCISIIICDSSFSFSNSLAIRKANVDKIIAMRSRSEVNSCVRN